MTSRQGRIRSICLRVQHLPARGIEIEEEFPPRRIANEASHPADGGKARAARHLGDVVQRGGGIGDQRSCIEFEGFLARDAFDRELAAIVAFRLGQEERERNVGAHTVHQRVIDVAAVAHAFLVAREEQWRERLRPHRQAKYLVAENAFRHQLADCAERTVGSLGLPIVLDGARGKARGGGAIDEARAGERGAYEPEFLAREHVADHDLHHGPSVAAAIEHATPAIRQVFAGAASVVVAGMVQNKDVTGPTPSLIISIPCAAYAVALRAMRAAQVGRWSDST
jgi:hypothetical protein